MELDEFYKLTCMNGQEFFIENKDDLKTFFKKIGFGEKDSYFAIKVNESNPVYIKSDKIFSIQKASKSIVGLQTKKWRLL